MKYALRSWLGPRVRIGHVHMNAACRNYWNWSHSSNLAICQVIANSIQESLPIGSRKRGNGGEKKCPLKVNKSYRCTAGIAYWHRRHFGLLRLFFFSRQICAKNGYPSEKLSTIPDKMWGDLDRLMFRLHVLQARWKSRTILPNFS